MREMLQVPLIVLGVVALGGPTDAGSQREAGARPIWTLPPLAPVPPALSTEEGDEHWLRYQALWDVTLTVWVEEGSARVRFLDENGQPRSQADSTASIRLAAGERVRVRVDADAASESVELSFTEAPSLEVWLEAFEPRPTAALEDGEAAVVDTARSLLGRAHALERGRDVPACVEEVRAALEVLDGVDAADPPVEAVEVWHDLGHLALRIQQPQLALSPFRDVLRFRSARVAPLDAMLQESRADLALALRMSGSLDEATELFEATTLSFERSRGTSDETVLKLYVNLAALAIERQEIEDALAMHEWLAVRLGDDPDLRTAVQSNLASILQARGEYIRSAVVFGEVVEALEEHWGTRHPFYVDAVGNHAASLVTIGDLGTAEVLLRRCLDELVGKSSADGARIQRVRSNLATVLDERGEHGEALELLRDVARRLEAQLGSASNPEVLRTRENLAATLVRSGRSEEAVDIYRDCVAHRERTAGPGHPDVLDARHGLSIALGETGELAEARAIEESVLATRESALPPGHHDLLVSRSGLCVLLAAQGEHAVLESQLGRLADDYEAMLRASLVLPPRSMLDLIDGQRRARDLLLSYTPLVAASEALDRRIFELLESERAISTNAFAVGATSASPEVERLREEALAARREVDRIVHRWRSGGEISPDSEVALVRAVRASDERIAELLDAGRELAVGPTFVTVDGLASSLGPGEAILCYRVYRRSVIDPTARSRTRDVESLAAYVLAADAFSRVELGDLEEITGEITAWREAMWSAPEQAENRLARRLLEPVARAVPDVSVLRVVLDGPLHLLPIDALPWETGLAGDRWRFRFACSLAPPRREGVEAQAPALLAVGGVDYGATDTQPRFDPLDGTRDEVLAIAKLFQDRFDRAAVVMSGDHATVARVRSHARDADFVHLASHGRFFDPAGRPGVELLLPRVSPLGLSGIALAGANTGPNAAGIDPGLLSAEVLSGWDLSRCQLAVLSACETNVGVQRAGQGVFSLQAAVHAAGARTALTSLWRVSDEATLLLMREFYRRLWSEGATKAQALWGAKSWLRNLTAREVEALSSDRHPQALPAIDRPDRGVGLGTASGADESYPFRAPAYWAGWILTGARD